MTMTYGTNQIVRHFTEKLKPENVQQADEEGYNVIEFKTVYFPPNIQRILGGMKDLKNNIRIHAWTPEIDYKNLTTKDTDLLCLSYYFNQGSYGIREIEKNISDIKRRYKYLKDDDKGGVESRLTQKLDSELNKLKEIVDSNSFSREITPGTVAVNIKFQPYEIKKEDMGNFVTEFYGTLEPTSKVTDDTINHPLIKGASNNSKIVELSFDGLVIKGKRDKGVHKTSYSISVKKGRAVDEDVIEDAEKIIFDFS